MRLYGNYDVVVVGGGASGASAALAAAREGANTLVIETLGAIGGMLNISGPPGWAFCHVFNDSGERIHGGIVWELYTELHEMGLAMDMPLPEYRRTDCPCFIDIDWAGILMFEKMREAGVHFLLHTMAVDVIKEGNQVCGVIVENTEGRMAVMGKVIIAADGEGDLINRAGVEYQQADRETEELDPPSITFHMDGIDWKKAADYFRANPDEFVPGYYKKMADWRDNPKVQIYMDALEKYDSLDEMVKVGVMDNVDYHAITMEAIANGDMHPYGDFGHYFTWRQFGNIEGAFQHTAQVVDCDTTNITDVSAGEVECRRQMNIAIKGIQKYVPGYDKAYLTRVTTTMRTREGRHTIGDYQLVSEDVGSCARFDDVIAKCTMPTQVGVPFHSASAPGSAYGTVEPKMYRPGEGTYDIPYRAMVPKGIEGMLMTGKLVSTTPDFKRDLLPDNMLWGQAAGIAAAVAVRNGKSPRELETDFEEVRAILLKNGAILDGVK